MHIIVEGPTATGKSTLIDALPDLAGGYDSVHMGQPEKLETRWVLKEYVLKWQRRKPQSGNLVADRWHWGEATYAPVYRPDTNQDGFGLLGKAGWRWTEMFLASRGAAVAVLTADNETLANRLEKRGDDHVKSLDELFQVSALYESARRDAITIAGIYDTSDKDADDQKYHTFIDTVVEEAKRREDAARKITGRWPKYIGPLNPQVLLVGDARNVTKKHGNETILPFMPVESNSGEFLLNSLPDMFWRVAGMINGSEVIHIDKLHKALGQPQIIALGDNAFNHLTKTYAFGDGVVMKMPHPAFVRRFMNSRQAEYGQNIVSLTATGEAGSSWTQ